MAGNFHGKNAFFSRRTSALGDRSTLSSACKLLVSLCRLAKDYVLITLGRYGLEVPESNYAYQEVDWRTLFYILNNILFERCKVKIYRLCHRSFHQVTVGFITSLEKDKIQVIEKSLAMFSVRTREKQLRQNTKFRSRDFFLSCVYFGFNLK
jgi:hypothetical protein